MIGLEGVSKEIPNPERTSSKELKQPEPFAENENQERNYKLPKNGGEWSGEKGNSVWNPDKTIEPVDKNNSNPEHKSWLEIEKQYGCDGIPFRNNLPDFSEICRGTVEIDNFTDNRAANFSQADTKMAGLLGCMPGKVKQWRTDNQYTWHECIDCKTMQMVPRAIHDGIPHIGGISEYKRTHNCAM